MPEKRAETIQQLAQLIADGSDIPWPDPSNVEDSGLDGDTLEDLKALARLACFHREVYEEAHAEISLEVKQWGPLFLVEKVGEGSFGEVFLAVDSKLDREVALKLLRLERDDAQGRRRALREGRLLAKINHPNVAHVYGADEHAGRVGVWMEFVRGLTLDQLVNLQGPFSANEAGGIGLEICRGLAAVHGQGLVHCDIKAQNVMRRQGGRILLVDFGLGAEPGSNGNGEKRVGGTPLYLAPETLQGAPVGRRSDIYALGVLLFFLTTDTFPILADDLEELKRLHGQGAGRLLSDARPSLPGWFIDVVQTALSPDPMQRFATAGQMERALANGLAPAMLTPPVKPRKRRRRPAWAVLFGLLLALALLSWYFLTPVPSRPLKPAGIVLAELRNSTGDDELKQISELLRESLQQQDLSYFELADEGELAPARTQVGLEEGAALTADSGLEVARKLYQTPVVIEPFVESLGDGYTVGVRIQSGLQNDALRPLWVKRFQISSKDRLIDQMRPVVEWVCGTTLPKVRARSRYVNAMRLKRDNEVNDAIQELSRSIEDDDPEFPLAYAQRGSFLVGQQRFAEGYGDLEAADKMLRALGSRDRESEFARMLVANSTEDYEANEVYSRQAVELERAKNQSERERLPFFILATDQYSNGKFRQALENFQFAAQDGHLKEYALPWLAKMHLVLKHYTQAQEVINSLEEQQWKELLLGALHFLRQEYGRANNAFQRMRTNADDDVVSDSIAAQALLQAERGQYEAARATLGDGIRHDTRRMARAEDPEPLRGRLNAKLLARAEVNSKLLAEEPDNRQLREEIAADCSQATTTREPMLLARAGIILAQAGMLAEAKGYAQLVDEQSFDIPISRRWRLKLNGEIQLAEGNLEGGLNTLEEVAAEDPAFYPREYLARALARAGNKEQAAEEYEKILDRPGIFWILPVNEMRPGLYAQTLLDWGRLAFDLHRSDEAKDALVRYLKLREEADASQEEAQQILQRLTPR